MAFPLVALFSVFCWIVASLWTWRSARCCFPVFLFALGSLAYFSFILFLWVAGQRPPLRTLGETRLWYSFFLSLVGLALYLRTRFSWMLSVSALLASVFAVINVCKPENFDASLMPALQSMWFVPHVAVYIFSYAILSVATLLAAVDVWRKSIPVVHVALCHRLVRMGWGLLTMGMVMGALWAKEAWGDYWTWDPKETWAAATWMTYLVFLHASSRMGVGSRFVMLVCAYLLLQMCWYGINFLPAAQGSVHTY